MDLVFGVDLSHHKPNFDCDRAAREGIGFVSTKATEGADFIDDWFTRYLEAANRAGLLFGAFHYVRSNATARAQVDLIKRVVPRGVPVIPDHEKDSGSVTLLRQVVALLLEAGYVVPLTYLPRWYWQQLGRPDLSGLPPLWSSRYPDNIVGSIQDEWDDVPASYWDGYGGLAVAMLQFTSSAAVSNYPAGRIDANAYRGTRTQLAALLGGTTREEDMVDQITLENAAFGGVANLAIDAAAQNPPGGRAVAWANALRAVLGIDSIMKTLADILAAEHADLDGDEIMARLEAASREGSAAGADRALRDAILPELDKLRALIQADNLDDAKAFVDEVYNRLRPVA